MFGKCKSTVHYIHKKSMLFLQNYRCVSVFFRIKSISCPLFRGLEVQNFRDALTTSVGTSVHHVWLRGLIQTDQCWEYKSCFHRYSKRNAAIVPIHANQHSGLGPSIHFTSTRWIRLKSGIWDLILLVPCKSRAGSP